MMKYYKVCFTITYCGQRMRRAAVLPAQTAEALMECFGGYEDVYIVAVEA